MSEPNDTESPEFLHEEIRVPTTMHAQLAARAGELGLTLDTFVGYLIMRYIDETTPRGPQ